MKNLRINHIVLAITFVLIASFSTYAQQVVEQRNKTKLSLELDPATFIFKGFAVHLRIQPEGINNLLFGAGAYAMEMPDVIVNINKGNKDKGWSVRINQGYGLFGEYYFNEVNKKWFVGNQIGIQEYKIENKSTHGNEKFTNILFMGYAGYAWQPFDSNFYIKPWVGIGYTSKISGNNKLNNFEYDISPITMFATLHIGYTF